jgi:hypothetical protein
MSSTLKAAIAGEEDTDLLATIAVPKNLKKMTLDLPAPCYPDSRPHSPESWPVTDPRRVCTRVYVYVCVTTTIVPVACVRHCA